MKKRIFINFHYMELGGAERALLGLLNALDTERVDVDLFINQHTGPFMALIPKKINLLPEMRGYNAIERPMKQIIKEGQFKIVLARLLSKLKFKLYLKKNGLTRDASRTHYLFDEVIKFLPDLHHLGEYDLAISFLDPPHIVQQKVLAKKRIEWIHTDWGTHHINYDKLFPHWKRNDYIASISPDITKSFLSKFPALKDKIVLIENILSPELIRAEAKNGEAVEVNGFDGLKLVSVGRISKLKNFDNIPFMAQHLKGLGLKFKWFIIGQGNHEAIDKDITATGIQDYVEFLGARSNPYPYVKACDIYVQPSRWEGKSVAVREAQILCKPVIITRYPTSSSQLTDGIDGVICEMDNESVAQAIYDLAHDKERQQKIISYLATHDYGNETEVDKIYQLINA